MTVDGQSRVVQVIFIIHAWLAGDDDGWLDFVREEVQLLGSQM